MIKLFKGDCLIESDKIESGSVDLILTDLPYGTMTKLNYKEQIQCRGKNSFKWDEVIDTKKVYEIANRILRKNGKMVLFCQQPFTNELITKAIPNIPFSYSMIWEKDNYGHALLAKKAPLNYYEDILVFSKKDDPNDGHKTREYFEEQRKIIKHISYKEINEKCFGTASNGGGMASNILTPTKKNWTFPTREKYEELQKLGICLEPYEKLKEIDIKHKSKFASTFNLWEGKKYKSNILKYKKDYTGYHPTQKPVLLLEDLIKTFSNEGNNVVDLTMGSGSTGVACVNTKRNFIGIEQDNSYFITAEERIKSAGFL
ncbi:MAG: site-specific DNA-methyltransferase (adenine-specific) [Polaribacter sp.]|jgi:site-specific DNA-methyltransferase (adenine-specific)